MNRNEVLKWIRDLSHSQFTELFYEVAKDRQTVDEREQSYMQEHFVLALATRTLEDEGQQWEDWEVALVAMHDEKEYPEGWGDDALICQSGYCCGHEVQSRARHFICPACGGKGFGTQS